MIYCHNSPTKNVCELFTHTKSSFYGNLQQKITVAVDAKRREQNNLKGEVDDIEPLFIAFNRNA